MIGKRRYAVWSLGLALLSGCGSDTPPDAVIKAVEANKTTTYTNNTVLTQVVDGTIHFKVELSATQTTPIGGAKVELSGSSPTVGDANAGFVGTSLGGPFLNPGDPNHLELTTDASGVVSVLYQFTVPVCPPTAPPPAITDDLAVSASISASIGGSSAIWIDNITVKKC
jgi:hypothetical protein